MKNLLYFLHITKKKHFCFIGFNSELDYVIDSLKFHFSFVGITFWTGCVWHHWLTSLVVKQKLRYKGRQSTMTLLKMQPWHVHMYRNTTQQRGTVLVIKCNGLVIAITLSLLCNSYFPFCKIYWHVRVVHILLPCYWWLVGAAAYSQRSIKYR